jgi:Sec-independent protein translocase protein TatA
MSLAGQEQTVNFLGMGAMEILVIFVIAFLALGPAKTIETARTAGRVLRDLRRTYNDVISAVSLEDDDRRSTGGRRPPSSSSESTTPPEDSTTQNPR